MFGRNNNRNSGSKPVCQFFLEGRCKFGGESDAPTIDHQADYTQLIARMNILERKAMRKLRMHSQHSIISREADLALLEAITTRMLRNCMFIVGLALVHS